MPVQPSTANLTLNKLHTLYLYCMINESTDFGDFLDALTTPALAQLTVQVQNFSRLQRTGHRPCFSQLLFRSQPPLKSFSLLGTYMMADNIVNCLRSMPELIIISGDGELFSTTVMDALTPSLNPTKVPLCPMLAMIGLKDESASFPALEAMIYARWKISKQKRRDGFNVQIRAVEVVELPEELKFRSLFLQSQEMAECIEDGLVCLINILKNATP
ncbi:hypothetical protein BD410DRAFT_257293 [Rickenella mellea]|uniref:Uncharacterized protein n=1 Tax=Rickenella mellea TaxID=50990 RepID=A0A4Y7Q602_9AGAM|nr:hypothetical protein BD410DRAFT_257293 [Rickenella mellea]